MLRKIATKELVPISLITLFGFCSLTWVFTTGIHPQITLAQPVDVNLPIRRQGQESYDLLILRAENLAKEAINAQFRQNPSLEAVRVVVIGENQGALAPVLAIKVSREQWTAQAQVKRWAIYFDDSKLLLGFSTPVVKPQPSKPAGASPGSQGGAGQAPTAPGGGQSSAGGAGQAPTAPGGGQSSAGGGQTQKNPQATSSPKPEQLPLTTVEPSPSPEPTQPNPTQRIRDAGKTPSSDNSQN